MWHSTYENAFVVLRKLLGAIPVRLKTSPLTHSDMQ